MRKRIVTKEEKVAGKMLDLVNDFTLDLDYVGEYLAEQSTPVLYNRLDTVIDSARYHLEEKYDR